LHPLFRKYPEPLPDDVQAKINAIVRRAEEAFKEMHFIA